MTALSLAPAQCTPTLERKVCAPISAEAFSDALRSIDWQRPWLAHLRQVGEPLAHIGLEQGVDALRSALTDKAAQVMVTAQCRGISTSGGLPIQFVAQEDLPHGQAYEAHIFATGCVPTRANLHDFFNALIWLHFPQIKVQLNAMQAAEIARAGVQAVRGGTRDAATLFDENAVLFVSRDAAMTGALEQFQWQQLFVERRADWAHDCMVIPFGHALIEKLVNPYKAITAHAWKVAVHAPRPIQALPWSSIDAQVSEALAGKQLVSRDFAPIPVLGIPGWWAENEQPMFYNDTQVFRLRRHNRS